MNQTANPEEETVYVLFSREIDEHATESLIDLMIRCSNEGVTHVCLLISTPGGSVSDGIRLHNVLRAFPFKLTTHNIGDVDSIGNVIYLAGEQRYTCANSRFMFHGVMRSFGRPIGDINAQQLRNALGAITADEQRIGSIIQRYSKLTEAQIAEFFQEEYRMNPSEAIKMGIAHEIKDIEIPGSSSIIKLDVKE